MILTNALFNFLMFIIADVLGVVLTWQLYKTIKHWIKTSFRELRRRGDKDIRKAIQDYKFKKQLQQLVKECDERQRLRLNSGE